jgi:hypothetical protein
LTQPCQKAQRNKAFLKLFDQSPEKSSNIN